MSTASNPREQVIALLDALPRDRLPEVVRLLEELRAAGDARPAGEDERAADEARLVEIARRALAPQTAVRLYELREREAAGRLSDADRAELRALEGRAERIDTERTAALLALARIRGVEVVEVVRALGLSAENGS